MRRRPARRGTGVPGWDDEDGATVALLLFSFFALLGVALLAIDGGLLFLSQRGQVADTDAGALAAARHLIEFPCATQAQVDGRAAGLVAANDAATSLVDREPSLPGDNVEVVRSAAPCDINATVVATTRREATRVFSGAFGFGPVDTTVTSYAQIVAPTAMADVVPLAFCESDPHVTEWQAYVRDLRDGVGSAADARLAYVSAAAGLPDHPATDGDGATYSGARTPVHRLPFTGVDSCGVGSPGNWGWVDFDGTIGSGPGAGNCSAAGGRLCGWITQGYPPGVTLGTPGLPATYDCDAADAESPPDDCPAGPGFRARLLDVLETTWRCPPATPTPDCDVLFVVLYDGGNSSGGSVAEYSFSGVMPVVLRDVGGNNANNTHLDVELVDRPDTGAGTAVPPGYTGPLAAVLCGADDFENCNQP